jgi:hypothetical protein
MIGVKFFAAMARFAAPLPTEASAFQVSALTKRSAAIAIKSDRLRISLLPAYELNTDSFCSFDKERKLALSGRANGIRKCPLSGYVLNAHPAQ